MVCKIWEQIVRVHCFDYNIDNLAEFNKYLNWDESCYIRLLRQFLQHLLFRFNSLAKIFPLFRAFKIPILDFDLHLELLFIKNASHQNLSSNNLMVSQKFTKSVNFQPDLIISDFVIQIF